MAEYLGRPVRIKVDTAGVGGSGATWVSIGQESGSSLERSTDTVDASHKDSGGWAKALPVRGSWSVSADIVLAPTDSAWTYILTLWNQQHTASIPSAIWVQIDESPIGGIKREGTAWITSITQDHPEADKVTAKVDFQGNGTLSPSP